MRHLLTLVLALVCSLSQAQTVGEIVGYVKDRGRICEVTPDSVFPTIREMERMRAGAKDSVAWAVISECLGVLYDGCVGSSQHDSQGETLEEWGRGQWREAAERSFRDARRPLRALRNAKSKDWTPFVELVSKKEYIDGSRWFDGDLLHVLQQARPSDEVADFYEKKVGGNAAIMARAWVPGTDMKALLRKAEADKRVCDDVRVQIYIWMIDDIRDLDTMVAECERCIAKYGKVALANSLRNRLASQRTPFLDVVWPMRLYPGREYAVPVRYRNIGGINVTVGKERVALPVKNVSAHTEVRDTLRLTAPATGKYQVTVAPVVTADVKSAGRADTFTVYVSPLRLLRITLPQADSARYVVVDALSGAPVAGKRVKELTTTEKVGRNSYKRKKVYIEGDPQPAVEYDRGFNFEPRYSEERYTGIYTDRAIYRPGQKVQLSLVSYAQRHWDARTVAGKRLPVTVFDNNRKKVFTDTLTTDEYGCAGAEFTLPAKASLGNYTIAAEGYGGWFKVEEYRRPTFAVELSDTLTMMGGATDGGTEKATATVTVRSFTGKPLRNARVTGTYSINSFWRSLRGEEHETDTLWTDAEGRAVIPLNVPGVMNRSMKAARLNVEVMAAGGETHNANRTYMLGRREQPAPVPNVMPRDTIAWFKCLNDTMKAGQPAVIEVGSAAKDVHLFMTVFRDSECIRHEEIVFSDSLLRFEFPLTLLDGKSECDGIGVAFAFMKDETVYEQNFRLLRPLPDKRLKWRWDTFRDLVRPGQDEVWSGTLLTPDGRPASANVMLTVYDASLDALNRHDWHFGSSMTHTVFASSYHNLYNVYSHYGYMQSVMRDWKTPTVSYNTLSRSLFNGFEMPLLGDGIVLYEMMRTSSPKMKSVAARGVAMEECAMANMVGCAVAPMAADASASEDGGTDTADDEGGGQAVTLRENFNETAYFVPTLRTDKAGRVTMRFTLPDCVTTWRVLGVAHTRDMMTARIEAEAIARKPFMALLDVPRFLRQGDEGSVAVTVQNVEGRKETVTLKVEVLDAATEKVMQSEKRRFESVGDTVIRVPLKTAEADMVVRASIVSASGSDGEQRLLPVLEASEWTARSVDLQCRGIGTHTFAVDSLFADSDLERRVTLQYTESPIWTAVDVLKNISDAKHDDAISVHTAFYANTLAHHISQKMPAVASHLKYSADTIAAVIEGLERKLDALRSNGGGYSWFPGFTSSRWITTEIATTMARLKVMTGEEHPHLTHAIDFLTICNSDYVEELKDMQKKGGQVNSISYSALQYLYVVALAGADIDKDTRYVLNIFEKQCEALDEEHPAMGREALAISTVVLERLGRKALADKTRRLMRHYLVSTEKSGTSFSYLRGSFTSIDRKLLDHIYAMEALQKGDTLLPEMRRHLLQQKRVQAWENPLVNAAAVYALMMGEEYGMETGEHDRIIVDGDVKMTVKDGRVQEKQPVYDAIRTVTIDKKRANESWGAVYVESRQPLSAIKAAGTGLEVRRYVETVKGTPFGVGVDARVRLVIHADRDYECVHVTAQRPACLESANGISRHHWQGGLLYYHEVHDACDDLFIERLPKGDYVLELPAYTVRSGDYNAGIARIECLYAPEFCGNTTNITLKVGE